MGRDVPKAKFHFYADDTVIYCCDSTLAEALGNSQIILNPVERQLITLRLILNAAFPIEGKYLYLLPVIHYYKGVRLNF